MLFTFSLCITYTPQGLSETFIFAIPAFGLPTFSETIPVIQLSKTDYADGKESLGRNPLLTLPCW